MKWVPSGWIGEIGIKPGESITVSVKAAAGLAPGHVDMQFLNLGEDFELPHDVPYGLQVLMRNHAKDHDHVSVPVIGPK
jgi:hypothetical protein